MRKLFFIPFIFGFGIIFNSCNIGDVGNVSTFPSWPAVVDYKIEMNGPVLCTLWGVVAAPSLIDCESGDCLYVHEFTIDYDNQPSTSYYTATNIIKESVCQSFLEESSSFEIGDYTLPLSAAGGYTSAFFNGKFFTAASCKDKKPQFRLVYNTEEPDERGVKNLYFLARPSSSTQETSDVTSLFAFDTSHLIYTQGRDTTITVEGYEANAKYKYIKANLKYISSITDGVPTYKTLIEPFEIYISNSY